MLERERIMSETKNPSSKQISNHFEPRGTLTFSFIAVRLSRDFINTYMRQNNGNIIFYNDLIIKYRF